MTFVRQKLLRVQMVKVYSFEGPGSQPATQAGGYVYAHRRVLWPHPSGRSIRYMPRSISHTMDDDTSLAGDIGLSPD